MYHKGSSLRSVHPNRSLLLLLALVPILGAQLITARAAAFEAFDSRLQVHGYFESQLRVMNEDFGEQWDVTQWYNIFNVEFELDLIQDPIGPLDLLQAYVRVEARFDCIWSRGCGMFRSMNAYGDRSQSLPRRLSNAEEQEGAGAIILNNGEPSGRYSKEYRRDPVPMSRLAGFDTFAERATGADGFLGNPSGNPDCQSGSGWNGDGFGYLCDWLAGGDEAKRIGVGLVDDTFDYLFKTFDEYRFTQIHIKGGGTYGNEVWRMGPWLPKNKIVTNAVFADVPNPYDNEATSEILRSVAYNGRMRFRIEEYMFTDTRWNWGDGVDDIPQQFIFVWDGALPTKTPEFPDLPPPRGWITDALRVANEQKYFGALPYRPVPTSAPSHGGVASTEARGLYLPSQPLRDVIDSGDLNEFPFNFSQSKRQWNRGYSQSQTKELKEAYFDLELFDSRLWLRLGKQTIVWGKTELFSFSDQFNPQDFALASLPSLEESRIALWAARGVYSFYNVGPLDDVRLELAFNFDRVWSDDLGACGEPYTPNLVCGLTIGGWAHGFTGLGVIGIDRPPSPWESLKGWEIGGRLEFRWDRYSFAIADFWGYDDLPYIDRVTTYERNIDPNTGRPRRYGAYGPCTGVDFLNPSASDPDCLLPGPQTRDADWSELDPTNNALDNHFANQTIFAMVCSGLPGIAASVDPAACATNVWNSQYDLKFEALNVNSFAVANLLSAVMSGHPNATTTLWSNSEITWRKKNGVRSPATRHEETGTRGPAIQLTYPPPFVGLSVDTQAQPGDNAYGLEPGQPPGQYAQNINQGYWDGNDLSNAGSNCIDKRRIDSMANPINPRYPECGGRFWEDFPPDNSLPRSNNFFDAGLSIKLTPEQEALLGCGPFWGTNCDVSGIDLLNADASVLFQSWTGMEGTGPGVITGSNDEEWRSDDTWVPQPGTIDFRPWVNDAHPLRTNLPSIDGRNYTSQILGGPRCTSGNLPGGFQDPSRVLPGCRGRLDPGGNGVWEPIEDWLTGNSDDVYDPGFDPKIDGNPGNTVVLSCLDHTDVGANCFDINEIFHGGDPRFDGYQDRTNRNDVRPKGPFGRHPLTGQHWQNELAAMSWNLLVLTIAGDDDFDGTRAYEAGVCSYVTPQHCGNVQGFFSLGGLLNKTVAAGGNGEFGRRTMQWQAGGEIVLRYDKRNVLGLAVDFAEDRTKTNWSLDFTYVNRVPMIDNLSRNNISRHNQYNLTISVDKPTFINFLNPNRTFFINSQWFVSYTQDYTRGLVNNGPWNILGTLTAQTGYFQDRLLATMTLVYDFMSVSGAGLPQVSYRFNQDFSVTLGLAVWFGRDQLVDMPLNPIGGVSSRWGDDAYKDRQSNGISPIRDRDEVFLRLRYTF